MFEALENRENQATTIYDIVYSIVEKAEKPVSSQEIAKLTGMKTSECDLILHKLTKRCEEIKQTYPIKTVFFGGSLLEFVQKQQEEQE